MGKIGLFFDNLGKKIRFFASKKGYTCELCGREIFDYPTYRLCEECFKSLARNEEFSCPKCGRATNSSGICLDCKSCMPTFTHGFSAFSYRDSVAELINRLKNGERYLAYLLAEETAKAWKERGDDGKEYLIVPVPSSPESMKKRGYNQAAELAEIIASKLGMEYDAEFLMKRRETKEQKKLTAEERRKNVMGVYRVQKGKTCLGKDVLLVDDIMTTGSTGSACAEALFFKGASTVVFLTVASVPEQKP